MSDPKIRALAVNDPPKKPDGPLMRLLGSVEDMARRLIALEARPLARDGRDGQPGRDGKDGVDGTHGPAGERGESGRDGKDGRDGGDGLPGLNGRGIKSLSITGAGELCVGFDDGVFDILGPVVGQDGRDGRNGVDGKDGESIKGDPGIAGQDGKPGSDGRDGADGKDGRSINGARVDDAGDLWIIWEDGTEKSVGRVVGRDGEPIKGDPGRDGKDGAGVAELRRAEGRLIIALSDGRELDLGEIVGCDGADGMDGAPGESIQGDPGRDGVGIEAASLDASGCLLLSLTDGRTVNAGLARGADGPAGRDAPIVAGPAGEPGRDGRDGRGITAASVSEDGKLHVTLTDGSEIVAGHVIGPEGRAGQGGASGTGIQDARIAESGDLELSLTDGRVIDLGRVVGNDGREGVAGPMGASVADARIRGVNLEIVLTDGRTINAGRVVGKDGARGESIKGDRGIEGPAGKRGPRGEQGPPGPSIEISEPYDANLSASDMSTLSFRDFIWGDQVFQIVVRN
jgi:hypothetical protein